MSLISDSEETVLKKKSEMNKNEENRELLMNGNGDRVGNGIGNGHEDPSYVVEIILNEAGNKVVFLSKDQTTLDLGKKYIEKLPNALALLPQLEVLHLDNNRLSKNCDLNLIIELSNLKILNLCYNNLETLPNNIYKLVNLEELLLSNNKLVELPAEMSMMKTIKKLDISFNRLKKMPKCVENNMENLEILDISGNKMFDVYASINSSKLTKFFAKNIRSKTAQLSPKFIFSTNLGVIDELNFLHSHYKKNYCELINNKLNPNNKLNIKKLVLQDCFLSESDLYETLKYIESFDTINIRHNSNRCCANCYLTPFQYFPSGVNNPDKTTRIIAYNVGISNISIEIKDFINLIHLDLSKNNIDTIPNELCSLKSLEIFIIDHNRLIMLPDDIGNLTSLKHFNLSSNNLSSLPNSISQLMKLEKLDLYNNFLDEIPKDLANIESLKALNLEYNLFDASSEVISQLIPWYREHRETLRDKGPKAPMEDLDTSSCSYLHRSSGNSVIEDNNSEDDFHSRSSKSSSSKKWKMSFKEQEDKERAEWNDDNWDDDDPDNFDPYNPPPIPPPLWQLVYRMPSANDFCPADYHTKPLKERMIEMGYEWPPPPPPPPVEGQFSDAESD